MERGINHMGRTHEPFAIQLPGRKLYIITDPKDVTEVFNNKHGLDNDYSLRELVGVFGVTPEGIRRAWHVPQPGDWCFIPENPINPQQMSFAKWIQYSYRKYLLTAETMEEICSMFVNSLLDTICTDSMESCRRQDNTVSLYTLIRKVMVEASTRSMFGPHLHEIDHNVVEYILGFNDNAWQVVTRYPDLFGRSAVSRPRKKMMAIIRQFVERPLAENSLANSFVRNLLIAMENTGLDMHSRAAMLLMVFWATVSNEYNATFWFMAHLLHDVPLLKHVKKETEAAWQSGELDVKNISDRYPVFDAVLNEVLRHKNSAGAMRLVVEKTKIGNKVLQPGNTVLIPFQQIHTNENVWGDNCLEFDHTRFLERKSMARNTSFRPFGGGSSYCAGKTLAKQEVFSAVAILLHRFDLRLAMTGKMNQPFPVLNVRTPSMGINGPEKGMDLIVEMTER
ncbi:hypothetical protein VMCG_09334 [Cytospora schulzeri]|uniref:Cytochrome P450 n=1 Tax=Cytospora schulzeri TaxID=448051 RepID=A0A423VJK6_9PEZI|nr:hypothetical protein VMCG_09334 [Valsa malicola]